MNPRYTYTSQLEGTLNNLALLCQKNKTVIYLL